MNSRIHEIKEKLVLLQKVDKKFSWQIFGVSRHHFKNEKVSTIDINRFENDHRIMLPEDFKDFLLEIGHGAGPDMGIFTLKYMHETYSEIAHALNTNSFMSHEFDFNSADAYEIIENWKLKHGFYKRLKTANGILPIQTEGCSYYQYIVISGEQKGKIWSLNSNEFDTMPSGLTKELSFLDWYEDWLNSCLDKLSEQINELNKIDVSKQHPNWWKKIFVF